MFDKHEQPTEAEEVANAAYVWRKKVQADLIENMRDVDSPFNCQRAKLPAFPLHTKEPT